MTKMNQQQRKQQLLRQLMQRQQMEEYRRNQANAKKTTVGDKIVGGLNKAKSVYEDINGINKAKTAWDAFKAPKLPSADFASKVGATEGLSSLKQGMNFNVPDVSALGTNTALTQTPSLQTGDLATKIGAGNAINAGGAVEGASKVGNVASKATGALQGAGQTLSKAMPVVGTVAGLASAGSNFAKGNHVDGAMDLAKTGAMFIPGVGWAVAGAIQIAQMLKGMMDKKKQEANAKAEKASQEAMQQSMTDMQTEKQQQKQIQADKAQAMADQLQKNNADTATATGSDVIDPTGINTPTEQQTPLYGADAGVKGFYSPEESKWLAEQQGMPTGMAVNLPQQPLPVNGSASQYNGQEEAYKQAVANMQQPPVPPTPQVPEEPSMAQAPTTPDVQAPEGQGGLLEGAKGIWDILQNKLGKVPENLSSGLTDFAEGYKDNTQTSFSQGDLAKMIQQPQEVTPSKTEDGTITGGVEEKKKSIMNRLGELAGTGQRIASHPLTQAGIAGLVSKMAGGEVDDIAKAMYEYGTKKAEADRYYQQTTGKTDRPFLNTYGADDYKTKIQKDEMDRKQANWQKEYDWKVAQKAKEQQLAEDIHNAKLAQGGYATYGSTLLERLKAQEEKETRKMLYQSLENRRKNDIDALESMSDYGEVATGNKVFNKTRPKTYEERANEINQYYDDEIRRLLLGESPTNYLQAQVNKFKQDKDGFYYQ